MPREKIGGTKKYRVVYEKHPSVPVNTEYIQKWKYYSILIREAFEAYKNSPSLYEIVKDKDGIYITKDMKSKSFYYDNYIIDDYLDDKEQAMEACLIELLMSYIQ